MYTAIIIYKTMVPLYLDYGDLLYAAANMCLLDKLQRLQNKALRIISYYNALISINELHVSNKLPYLVDKLTQQPKFIDNRNLLTRAHDKKLLVMYQPN